MSLPGFEQARRPSVSENQTIQKSEIPLNERFFRYFQHEITALQEQMDKLADTSLVGGERTDATDHCLAGIARLSNEVKDAASYIPTYDQRIYAEAIKALQDRLAETRAVVEPRPRFTFKSKKNPATISLSEAADAVAQGHLGVPGYRSPGASSMGSSGATTPNYPSTPLNEPDRELNLQRPEIAPTSVPKMIPVSNPFDTPKKEQRSTHFEAPSVSSVSVNDQQGLHIMLPASASSAAVPASATSLRRCVVDMSIPAANGKPYASLMIKNVSDSLLICGQVDGPAHVTGVRNSIIVVDCRQFRMHDCKDVDVYLSSSSNPIIEDCTEIRFGRIPRTYALDHDRLDTEDRWNQVEDFKWIKPDPSPNWSLLGQDDGVPESVWAEIVPGGPGWSLDDILRAINIISNDPAGDQASYFTAKHHS